MIKLFGHGDDLVVIEGDINDEISPSNDEILLAVSDGTLLSVKYDTMGCWRMGVVRAGSRSQITVMPCLGEDADRRADGTPGYSDVVEIGSVEGITWVAAAETVVRS